MPAKASERRSRTGPSSLGTSSCPSRKSRPTGASSTISAGPGARRTMSPLRTLSTSLTPQARASLACSARCRASPCMGMAMRGFTQPYISFSSSRRGWPVTCTSASPSVTISQPRSTSRFWMRPTARSLPGMVREEKMTRSPLSEPDVGMLVVGDARQRGARLALAAGAQQHHLVGLQVGEMLLVVILEAGRQIARLHGHADDAMHGPPRHHQLPAGSPGGIRHGPDARHVGGEDGDGDAPLGALDEARRASGPRRVSEGERPSRSALVESQIMAVTPSAPSCDEPARVRGRARSPGWPRSSSRRCAGRRRAACGWRRRSSSGIECATEMSSRSNGPTLNRPSSGTSLIGSCSLPPNSASLDFSIAAVKGVA